MPKSRARARTAGEASACAEGCGTADDELEAGEVVFVDFGFLGDLQKLGRDDVEVADFVLLDDGAEGGERVGWEDDDGAPVDESTVGDDNKAVDVVD